jgi:serine/threonine-protein kinase
MLTAMLSQTPPPITNFCEAPPELDELIARCLDKEPAKRFRDVLQLADALDELLLLDDSKTEIGAPLVRISDEQPAVAEDSLTWNTPEPAAPVRPMPKPLSAPVSTLPGVAAPVRNSFWPETGGADPRKKR